MGKQKILLRISAFFQLYLYGCINALLALYSKKKIPKRCLLIMRIDSITNHTNNNLNIMMRQGHIHILLMQSRITCTTVYLLMLGIESVDNYSCKYGALRSCQTSSSASHVYIYYVLLFFYKNHIVWINATRETRCMVWISCKNVWI